MRKAKKAVRKAAAKQKKEAAKKNARVKRAAVRENSVSPQMRRILLMDEINKMRRIEQEDRILVHCFCNHETARHCALLSLDISENAMKSAEWDLRPYDGYGFPGFSRVGNDDTYHRHGGSAEPGIEPLVFLRDYSKFKPASLELSEEFRHYHNLYWEEEKGEYVKFDESGNPSTVAKIEKDGTREIWVRAREIRQFLAAKQMALAVFFWVVRTEMEESISVIPKTMREDKVREKNLAYNFKIWHDPNIYAPDNLSRQGGLFSRLCGKALITPPPMKEAGIWPFKNRDDEDFPSFWCKELVSGKEVRCSCNPDKLGGPFLSGVVCRSTVLDKYRKEDHFTVSKHGVRCGNQWDMPIVTQDGDHVAVHLGEVGQMPEPERRHWAAHNIRPSEWNPDWRNQNHGIFDFPELREDANRLWEQEHGWPLFRPLAKGDEHHLRRLHIPSGNNQGEFDEQILSLTMLLINYLNTDKMEKAKGNNIARLNATFMKHGLQGREHWISFLSHLQGVRSHGVAHPKNKCYPKHLKELGVSPHDLKSGFTKILEEAADFLQWLRGN